MARTNQIQFRRGTATQWSTTNPVLASGEPGFDTTNNLFRLGDGTTAWNNLINVGSNLYSTTRGSEIVTANKSAFTVTGGYVSGNLDVYWNGLKFLRNDDFTETSSTIFTLTNPAVSGDIVEWVGLVGPATYQISDAGLTSIASLTTGSGNYIYATASDVYTTGVITAFGRSLVDDADASTARTTLGLGTLATQSGTFSGTSSGTNTGDQTLPTAASLNLTVGTYTQAYDAGLTSIASLTTASGSYLFATANDVYTTGTSTVYGRSVLAASGVESLVTTTLTAGTGIVLSYNSGTDTATINTSGLVIGTNIQAYDAELAAIAGLTSAANKGIQFTGSGTAAVFDLTTAGKALLDDADASAQRTTLGLVIGTDVAPIASPTFTGIVTTAGQIAFPATANLSAGANTLDDYEEGTWTPTFTATTTNPTVTYDTAIRYGIYVKIGKTVFISCTVVITVLTAAGSGDLRISGLPFTASSGTTGGYGSLAIGYKTGWTTTTPGTAFVQAGGAYITLGNELLTALITTAHLSAASYIQLSGFYNTTS